MNEEVTRRLVAQSAAHATLIGTLLRIGLASLTPDEARAAGEAIKTQANDTTSFTNAAVGDEFRAERLADMAILMQQHVADLVDNAVEALAKGARK